MTRSPDEVRALLGKLEKIFPPEGSRLGDELSGRLAFLRRLFASKVAFEIETSLRNPLVAVVMGGTNVGKSEVFNALAGRALARPDPRAGTTRRPAVFCDSEVFVRDPRFLPGYERLLLADPAILNEPCGRDLVFHFALGEAGGLVLVDSPDIDSHRTENLARAEHLLAAADTIVFVTSPSKYNDEACVTFLRRALDLGRRVSFVFNFLDDEREKVLADFRASVLPSGDWDVTEVGRLAGEIPAEMAAALAGLRGRLRALPAASVREEQVRGAVAFARREFAAVAERIESDLDTLSAIRARAEESAHRALLNLATDLASEKSPEIEIVFAEALDHFRVPVVDDILNAPARAARWVFRKIQGKEPEAVETEQRIRSRRERYRRKTAEIVDALRGETLRAIAEGASDPLVAALMKRVSSGRLGGPAEKAIEAAWDEMEPRVTAWRDAMRAEMIERIRKSPNLRITLQASKALLQVGTGVLTGLLLGAPIVLDIATASVAAKLTQYVIETFGNAYFEDKRRAYVELQTERFQALTRKFLLDPLAAAMPPQPDRTELAAIRGELERL